MSASPEMAALVQALVAAERDEALCQCPEHYDASERADIALYAAIGKLEAARDEATRRLAVVEEAVRVARKSIGVLVDHFEAMGGEEDSSQLAYDLQAISDGLRAALENSK